MPRLPRLFIALIAGSLWLSVYELSLLRQTTVLFNRFFSIFAIAMVLSGLGIGGGLASRFAGPDTREQDNRWISVSLCTAGLTAALGVIAPYIITLGSIPSLIVVLAAMAGPSVSWGVCMGVLYRENTSSAGYLYAANMFGAALGVGLCLFLLDLLDGPIMVGWLACAGLAVTGFAMDRAPRSVILTVATFITLVFGGDDIGWDKAPLPHLDSSGYKLGTELPAVLKQSQNTEILDTQWNTHCRTDLVGLRQGQGGLRWVYTDGIATSVMPGHPNMKSIDWLKEPFPLFVLPLLSAKPKTLLVLSPGGGLEIRMAKNAGVPSILGIEPNRSMKPIMERSRRFHGSLLSQKGVKVIYGNVRNLLQKDPNRYDVLYLSIREPLGIPWIGWGLRQSYLTTKEAFQAYWNHLTPDGMLVITAVNEPLFERALLTIWETLEEQDGRNRSLGDVAWGFQIPPSSPYQGNGYNFLLMVNKRKPDNVLADRVRRISKDLSVQALFGPGLRTSENYSTLTETQSARRARDKLAREISNRFQAPIDLSPATDEKPFFSQAVRRIDPYTKWTLGLGLGLLIIYLLFPLPEFRPLDAHNANDRPPVPIFLSYFVFLGAGLIMAEAALVQRAALIMGHPNYALTASLCTLMMGMGIGAFLIQQKSFYGRRGLFAASVLAVLGIIFLMNWIFVSFSIQLRALPGLWKGFVIAVSGFSLGTCAGVAFPFGLHSLSRQLPKLVSWAWAANNVALVIGVVLIQWTARFLGWSMVGVGAAGCYAIVLGLGLWLWKPSLENNNV